MPVRHLQRLRIPDIDLLLARAPLALGILDRDAGALQAVAEGPHHDLVLRRLQDVIVLDVVPGRLEVAVALLVGALVAVVEEEELELRRHIGLELHGLEAPELLLEHRSRRVGYVLVVMIDHVADHECGAGEPGDTPQRRHVGLEGEVSVAQFPARGLVSGHRLHLDVDAEEIVAAVRLLVPAVGEVLRMEALADEPALQIHHGGDDCVDRVRCDLPLQLLEGQHSGGHPTSPLSNARLPA